MMKVFNWLMSFNESTTAAEDIAQVLGGFTDMVEKLDGALAKAHAEFDASWNRQDAAYEAYVEVRDAEQDVRVTIRDATQRAQTARNNIAALVGEDA
jgi:hypothetical protein